MTTTYRKGRHAGVWDEPDGTRYSLTLTAELRILEGGSGLTIDHEPRDPLALELSIIGSTEGYPPRGRRFDAGAGQNRDDLARVTRGRTPSLTADQRATIGAIWDRWHLNGMRSLCAHQPEAWTCTNLAKHYPTPNGWPVVRSLFGEHPYPNRGDQCHRCGRNRWDEPTDHCPVTGYRAGTAWLTEPLPADVVAAVLDIFGPVDVRVWPLAATVPALHV